MNGRGINTLAHHVEKALLIVSRAAEAQSRRSGRKRDLLGYSWVDNPVNLNVMKSFDFRTILESPILYILFVSPNYRHTAHICLTSCHYCSMT